jgi:zinc protease
MFGGGSISNKTSRLYRLLVEQDKAVNISGGLQATVDPYLYDILAILPPGQPEEEVLQVIDAEIKRLQDSEVPVEDIQRAIKQAKALFAYGSENTTNQAFWLGYSAMFADPSWFDQYIPNLEQVDAGRLMQAARKYLNSQQRVVGIYHPKEGGK